MLGFIKQNARWLGAGALLSFISSFGQTFFFAVFSGKIIEMFELTPGLWGQYYMIGTFSSAVLMVWAGVLADHLRARILGPMIFIFLALSCVLMWLNPFAALLPFLVFLLRFSGQGMAGHLANVSMSRWFSKNRGKALSCGNLGFALGEAFLPMIFVALMGIIYWKNLWLIAALISLLAAPLLHWLLQAERTPKQMSQQNVTLGMNGRHWSRRDLLRHWLFWLMIPALIGPPAFNTAFMLMLPYFSQVNGFTQISVVSLLPFQTFCSIVFVFISGFLIDKIGAYRLIPFYLLPVCVAFLLFAQADNLLFVGLGFFFVGMTAGTNATLASAFWAEFYGTRHLGAIKSAAAAIMVLGSAIGPGIMGFLIDYGVPLNLQYLWVSAYFMLSAALATLAILAAQKSLNHASA